MEVGYLLRHRAAPFCRRFRYDSWMRGGFTRREFLGCATTASAAWYLSRFDAIDAWAAPPSGFFEAHGPIDRSLEDTAPARFFGDEFERAHQILWDLPTFLKTQAAPTRWEETPLAIVGGGLSGLFTAYAFRDYRPIVLEQAPRFGGNAKGQSWRGTDFGLGSAYFPLPEKGTPLHRFYTELKLDKLVQVAPDNFPVGAGGKFISKFWDGAAEPQHRATYVKLEAFLKDVNASKAFPFPEIPTADGKRWNSVQNLDAKNFRRTMEEAVGPLSPLLSQALEAYSWSAFGAAADEVSAAAGLCFFASDSRPICVAPGGNAGIAEHLLKAGLSAGIPKNHFRPSALVVKVQADADGVRISYADADGKLRGVKARAAVLACPKFAVAKVLEGIEPERRQAFSEIEYRSYLTAGVLIQKPLRSRFYDLFLLNAKQGEAPRRATDAVVGSLGQLRGRHSVLTLYRPVPAKSRTALLDKNAYATVRAEFRAQIEDELLPLLGFQKADLADLRIARWGHALPVPKPGVYARNLPQALRKPFGGRIFFVEQDNWLAPAIETCAGDLALQESLIRSVLDAPGLARRSR